jgi:hypothetical protein
LGEYWESIGPAPDRNDGTITRALAFVTGRAETGERVALVAFFNAILSLDDGSPKRDYSEFHQLSELRFVGSDSSGFFLELREGTLGDRFHECAKQTWERFIYAISARSLVLDLCSKNGSVSWGPWRSLRFAPRSEYTVRDSKPAVNWPELRLEFIATGSGLQVVVVP